MPLLYCDSEEGAHCPPLSVPRVHLCRAPSPYSRKTQGHTASFNPYFVTWMKESNPHPSSRFVTHSLQKSANYFPRNLPVYSIKSYSFMWAPLSQPRSSNPRPRSLRENCGTVPSAPCLPAGSGSQTKLWLPKTKCWRDNRHL